jgi:hypothetical protein
MKRRLSKLKIAFLTFGVIVFGSVIGGVEYLESQRFANQVKQMISTHSDRNLGIVGDFSNLELHLFPPGLGVMNAAIHIDKDNISKLPVEGEIEAKEMRVSFAPIQMLSGTIQIDEVLVREGSVIGKIGSDVFSQKKPKAPKLALRWQDLFKLQINGVRFEDTYLNVHSDLPRNGTDEPINAECVVKHLALKKKQADHQDSFVSDAVVNAVRVEVPKDLVALPIKEASTISWNMELNDQGLQLDPFFADLSGIAIKIKGKITGNLLDPSVPLKLAGDASVTTDLNDFFTKTQNDESWQGDAAMNAQFEANLNDFAHTFKGAYEVSATDVSWKTVRLSNLQGSGKMDLAHQKIDVKSLVLEDHANPKHPGMVKISEVSIPLEMNEPFQTKLTLSQADMHWLGGPVLADVYALEGRLNGEVELQFTPGVKKAWRLKAQTNLKVEDFALTNQSMKIKKPLKFILRPKLPVQLDGELLVTPGGFDLKNYVVKMMSTRLEVTGGVHGKNPGRTPNGDLAKVGFDLHGSGPIELKEFDEIAENKIHGVGTVVVNVHGPVDRVLIDFDADLKDASYLEMNFGDVHGRITYDDGIRQLRFANILAQQRNTFYGMKEGFIDLGESDAMHMMFQVRTGRIEDITYVLEPLLRKVTWFPKALTGDIHGDIDLGGQLSTPKMILTSKLEGSDWTWFGEKARSVHFNFGYDRGTYYVHNAVMVKTSGEIHADVDFDSYTTDMNWNVNSVGFSLADFDFVDRLEIPVKAKIEVKSSGSGKLAKLKSKTEGRVYAAEIKGEALEPSTLTLEQNENTLRGNCDLLGTSFHSQFKYALADKQPSSFSMDFNHFDFSPVLLVVNPKLLDDPLLKGTITGKVHLDFLTGQAEFARGEIQLAEYDLEKTGFSLTLVDPVKLPVQLGYFNLPATRFRFKNGELKLHGDGRKGIIDLYLDGTADMAIAELLSSSVQRVNGKATTELRMSGPLKELALNGDLSFTGASVNLRFLQTPFEEMDGAIHLRKGLIYIDSVEAYLGEEVFTLSGRIETFTNRFPSLDLRGQFDDNKIKMLPLDMIQARGIATIKGTEPPYVIGGSMDVPQALWTKSFGGSGVSALGDRFAPKNRESAAGGQIFVLDLDVTANQGFFVKNEIMDAEFKGKIKLVGPPDNPKILGEGSVVQGKVLFKDHPFNLETVKIEFDDPYQLNPKINAVAEADVNQYKIRVLAYGRANTLKAELSSTPFLPENDIYSLLASGLTTTDTSRFKNRDRTWVNQGQAASLILHSMDFSRDVQTKTGFQFDVEEAVDDLSANSIFRPQLQSDVAAPKVVLKRRVGEQITLSLGSTVGVGNETQREVNAEYSLSHGTSLLGVWTNIEESEENTQETRTSYGLDLKFNKKFK